MEIDVNLNNKQKHWVLVIIDKCKTGLSTIFSFIWNCIKAIGRFIKRIWKILVGLAALAIIIVAAAWGYDYYTNEYIPQKKLDTAIEEITSNINSKNDSIKSQYALFVLDKKHQWGYEDVSDVDISSRLAEFREKSFKLIESKAYSGDAKWQFTLGQIYRWGNKQYYLVQQDFTKAAYWWNEAASNNYIEAYNNIGIAYKLGKGVKVDLRKAVEYLKKGAEAGEDYAQRNYGDLFMEGIRIKTGSHKVIRSTKEYCADDDNVISTTYDSKSMKFVTRYYEEVNDYEILIPKDIEQAKYWWKKSAAQGNEVAKERLQKIY